MQSTAHRATARHTWLLSGKTGQRGGDGFRAPPKTTQTRLPYLVKFIHQQIEKYKRCRAPQQLARQRDAERQRLRERDTATVGFAAALCSPLKRELGVAPQTATRPMPDVFCLWGKRVPRGRPALTAERQGGSRGKDKQS